MESEQLENWIKKAFWFLVDQHNFKYNGYFEGRVDFISQKVKVRVEPGHKTPRTYIYRVGEPEFTHLVFEGILRYLEGKAPDVDFQKNSLERNLEIEANILKEHAPKIIDHIDEWWIPVHLFQYRLMEKDYKESNQLDDFLYSFKRDYDYLKSKGAI